MDDDVVWHFPGHFVVSACIKALFPGPSYLRVMLAHVPPGRNGHENANKHLNSKNKLLTPVYSLQQSLFEYTFTFHERPSYAMFVVTEIIIPYVNKVRKRNKLPPTQKALLLWVNLRYL